MLSLPSVLGNGEAARRGVFPFPVEITPYVRLVLHRFLSSRPALRGGRAFLGALALFVALVLSLVPSAQAQTFSGTTGNMTTTRGNHTATLLNDGTVLLTGGNPSGNGNALATAEIYDPTSKTFTATTGNMTVARTNHTATLLNDGTVLIAGGTTFAFSNNGILASAEIYNPTSKTFTPTTGAMTKERFAHTATLLNDGTVLIVGGVSLSAPNTAELYNPTTKTFTRISASLTAFRYSHTATLLTDGTVLLAGGQGSQTTAELYNPSTQTFVATSGGLTASRIFHTATPLTDGTVLLAGGQNSSTTAEIYNPTTKTFAMTSASLTASRYYHTATPLNDGTVLITGGQGSSGTAELYNPTSKTFAAMVNMTTGRTQHTATLLGDDTVLLAGGSSSPTAELYDPGPRIRSFSPTGGLPGNTVVITGVGFTTVQAVTFNGAPASYAVNSSTQITATVPNGATTGPIRVIRSGASTLVSRTNFTVYGPTVVTTTADVTNPNDGQTSLREAIAAANSSADADTITFAIPGMGVQTITLTSALPTITGANGAGTVIDGYSQSGATVNTLSTGSNAAIKIELRGTGTGSLLAIGAVNCTVKGLSLTNATSGVNLSGATGTKLTGNFIGVRADGITSSRNQYGVFIQDNVSSSTIGGATPAERNVISGNTVGPGILFNGARGTKVQGNLIGLAADGTTSLPNATGIDGVGNNNTIGGIAAGEGNVISYNTNAGIAIKAGTGNSVRGNSIYNNGFGIDLASNGVTVNDNGDGDTGANNLQNFPTISSAIVGLSSVTLTGSLNSTASTTFNVDFYSSPTANSSGYGEGQTFLGSTSVTTDGAGNASFNTTLSGVAVAQGAFISATATDPNGNTSEFSQNATTSAAPLKISEFRLSGPGGDTDEYIELANRTGNPVDLTGYTLAAGSVTTPLSGLNLTGKVVPASGYLLITNSGGYSLGSGSTAYPSTYPVNSTTPSAYATGDVVYTGDIDLNSTLTLSFGSTVIDTVGDVSGTAGLVSNSQYAFVRRQDGATIVDTDDDTNDFNLVSTSSTKGSPTDSGVSTLVAGARLGTPGPQNSASPNQRATLTLVPLNPATNQGIVPDGRYATRGSNLDPFGRLTLRRTITNYGSTTLKQIRFVLVRTTAGSGVSSGSGQASGVADLRAITSVGVSANGSKVVQAIQIEAPTTPTTPSNQLSSSDTGNGGGLNASWNVGTLPAGGLAPGQSMNVEFVFGIVKEGNYNISIVIQTAS